MSIVLPECQQLCGHLIRGMTASSLLIDPLRRSEGAKVSGRRGRMNFRTELISLSGIFRP